MKTVRDICELHPTAQIACKAFLTECEKLGLKVRITETYRSQERQNELYAQGRTKPGNKVTWTLNSRHTTRRAWDICQNIKGREYDASTGFFEKCGEVAKRLGITWGGNWKTPDRPHFEVSEKWELPEGYAEEEKIMEELRQEIARLEHRISILEREAAVYNYIDENMPNWIENITKWGIENGIITGTGDGLGITKAKAECMVMIKNALKQM